MMCVLVFQVYKALHRHVVLSSPPTATAVASTATMSALNDRLNVLGYLCSNAHSAEVSIEYRNECLIKLNATYHFYHFTSFQTVLMTDLS